MWEAGYVALVHKSTGLTPREIRWELPLSEGLAYYHAEMTYMGNDCEWVSSDNHEWFGEVRDFIRSRKWRD